MDVTGGQSSGDWRAEPSSQSNWAAGGAGLQVVSEPIDLVHQEVNVCAGCSGVGDDHAEEVDLVPLRLVAHHGRP